VQFRDKFTVVMKLDCDEIIPGRLWVGAYLRDGDTVELKHAGITIVISLQSDEDLELYDISIPMLTHALRAEGIRLIRIPIQDFSKDALERKLPEAVSRLLSALEPAAARVYLHCTAGINRAPTTAAAYLIFSRNMPAREAWGLLTAKRHCSPYLDVLERYADSLGGGTLESTRKELNP
jgi:protein-tyrosine phosphatase